MCHMVCVQQFYKLIFQAYSSAIGTVSEDKFDTLWKTNVVTISQTSNVSGNCGFLTSALVFWLRFHAFLVPAGDITMGKCKKPQQTKYFNKDSIKRSVVVEYQPQELEVLMVECFLRCATVLSWEAKSCFVCQSSLFPPAHGLWSLLRFGLLCVFTREPLNGERKGCKDWKGLKNWWRAGTGSCLAEAVSQPCYLRRAVKEEVIMVWSHPLDLLDFQLQCVAPGDLVECN